MLYDGFRKVITITISFVNCKYMINRTLQWRIQTPWVRVEGKGEGEGGEVG